MRCVRKCILLLGLCAIVAQCTRNGEIVQAAPVYELSPTLPSGNYVQVHKGDTLYSIAWTYGLDYQDLAGFNALKSPYKLSIGQKLWLAPKRAVTNTATVKVSQPSSKKTVQKKVAKVKTHSTHKQAISKNAAKTSKLTKLVWQWPIDKPTHITSAQRGGLRGVDLATKLGSAVHAAAPGTVVYTGSGIKGYGQLVIVKHNRDFLTAYGFNRKIIVHDGEQVAKGQILSYVGMQENGKTALHFEIRKHGKSVDPIKYLPKKKV